MKVTGSQLTSAFANFGQIVTVSPDEIYEIQTNSPIYYGADKEKIAYPINGLHFNCPQRVYLWLLNFNIENRSVFTELNETVESAKVQYTEYIQDRIKEYGNNNLCRMIGAKSNNQLINTINRGSYKSLKKWANIIEEYFKKSC